MNTPEIRGDRIVLCPFSEDYITNEYISWLNNPEIVKYSEQRHKKHNQESCKEYFLSTQRNGHYFWAILNTQSSNKHIGNLTAYIDRNNLIADMAIMIGDLKFQGQGYGQEAWILACDYLLKSKKIRKVTAGTMAINIPMLKIMQSSGMHQEGIRGQQFLVNGKAIDLILTAKYLDHVL